MEDYLNNLINQLKCGNIDSRAILEEVDRSSVNNLSTDGLGLSEIKSNGSTTRRCYDKEPDFSVGAFHPKAEFSSPEPVRFTKPPSSKPVILKAECSGEKENMPVSTHNISKKADLIIAKMREQNSLALKPQFKQQVEDSLPVSNAKTPKNNYSAEKLQNIRQRSAKKHEDKRNEIRIERHLKEEEEYEKNCIFKPQLNTTKNRSVSSKYMEDKQTPSSKNKLEQLPFKPIVNDNPSTKRINNYLSHDPFTRLSTQRAFGLLSSKFANTDAVGDAEDADSPDQPRDLAESLSKCTSSHETGDEDNMSRLIKQYTSGKVPGARTDNTRQNCDNYESSSVVSFIHSCTKPDIKQQNHDQSTYEDLEEEFERLAREGQGQIFLSDLATGQLDNEADDSDDMCGLAAEDFHSRQEVYEKIKQRKLQQITKKVSASHKPTLNEKTQAMVKKDPKLQDFFARSQYFEDRKRGKLEKIQQQQNEQSVFKPKITKLGGGTVASSIDTLVYGHNKLKDEKLTKLRKEKAQKEVEELILYPEINRRIDAQSKLGLKENVSDYIKQLKEKEEIQGEFKKMLVKRKEIQETIECTHRPQINSAPTYLKQLKPLTQLAEPSKYSRLHEKKSKCDTSSFAGSLLDSSAAKKTIPNSLNHTLQLTVNDLWNTSNMQDIDAKVSGDQARYQSFFGAMGESLNELIPEPQQVDHGIEAIDEKDELDEQTTRKTNRSSYSGSELKDRTNNLKYKADDSLSCSTSWPRKTGYYSSSNSTMKTNNQA